MSDSTIVKLNVGGVLYTTTRSTLTKFPDSMLGAMFSGNMPTAKDENGNYFIDRDGELFRYVLEFLRTHQVIMPEKAAKVLLRRLQIEADFYQIVPFVEKMKKLADNQLSDAVPATIAGKSLMFLIQLFQYDNGYWSWKTEGPPYIDSTNAYYKATYQALYACPRHMDKTAVVMKLLILGAQPFQCPRYIDLEKEVFFVKLDV